MCDCIEPDKKNTCYFRIQMIIVAEGQGTASFCHLVRETTLKNIHPSFNALQDLIRPANTIDEPGGNMKTKTVAI